MTILKLTDPEKQEIIRFMGADKLELVWNGKTNETCNIVLPFQVIAGADGQTGGKKRRCQAAINIMKIAGDWALDDYCS